MKKIAFVLAATMALAACGEDAEPMPTNTVIVDNSESVGEQPDCVRGNPPRNSDVPVHCQ